jgi:hypothetical protein
MQKKDTESGVETEPMPAALRFCVHDSKLIRWTNSEPQQTCAGVGVSWCLYTLRSRGPPPLRRSVRRPEEPRFRSSETTKAGKAELNQRRIPSCHPLMRAESLLKKKDTTLCVFDNSTYKDSLGAGVIKPGCSACSITSWRPKNCPVFPAVLAGTPVTRSTANTMIDPAALPDPGVVASLEVNKLRGRPTSPLGASWSRRKFHLFTCGE